MRRFLEAIACVVALVAIYTGVLLALPKPVPLLVLGALFVAFCAVAWCAGCLLEASQIRRGL